MFLAVVLMAHLSCALNLHGDIKNLKEKLREAILIGFR